MVEVGLFIVGILFATLWFGVIVLPLIYGLPLALYWAAKGWAGWKAPALYLVPPVIWSGIFLGVALVITLFFPAVGSYLRDSGGFWWGQNVAVLVSIGRVLFSKASRLDMRSDFLKFMLRHLTIAGSIRFRKDG